MKKFHTCLLTLACYSTSFTQNVGIGTLTPSEKLHVNGNVKADTLKPNALKLTPNAAVGKVLTSDASGNASWQTSQSGVANIGYGVWGDCATNGNIAEYDPVAASDAIVNANFGYSVSLSGNYAIIGAQYDNVGANTNQGSAYIFFYNGSTWVQQQKLTASDGAPFDFFGFNVNISGNYAIVGAYGDDNGANTDQGSAYIFFYNGSSWVQQQKLTAADGATDDFFGSNVNVSGNYAIVGAYGDDVSANIDQGSAYIFFFNGSSWVQQQKLTASDGVGSDNFGYAVSISGNYAIAGAYGDDISANSNQGSAYIFFYNGSTWVQQQKLTASDGAGSDFFGISVNVSGSYAIIGAFGDDIGSVSDQGSGYIFFYNGSTWVQQQKLTAFDGASGDDFGVSVIISGNYLMVGAELDDINSTNNQGSVYLYQKVGGVWRYIQKIIDPGGTASDGFGFSCSLDNTNKRFVIGASGAVSGRGLSFFGKIN